ncbi:autotransporter adhesin BigA [Enterobacter oligotrophicus]|uniref:BigA/YdbA N-terminal beta-barrel domain-containing protein n=1 Tax=Enterobacter TaxID=547 RepID=UPI0028B22338|nr:autotransporter adhesin BigA [Enterobacter oligotrophicus]ELW1647411.1 autotransporter adhesin BigA [Enterobacter oligotrophicus]
MQRKKFLAAAIAIALQTSYAPVFAAETPDDDNDCPTNISSLSQQEKEKLSDKCLIPLAEQDNHWGWISGGIAALAAGVAIGIENNGGDDAHHNNVSPVPPDDGGDVTPVPPDDGGDNTPVPPDDDDDTPVPDTRVTTYDNGVTLNRAQKTITIDYLDINGTAFTDVTFTYASTEDGKHYILTAPDGTTLLVDNWHATAPESGNGMNAVFSGTTDDGHFWKYDSRGNFILASDQTVITDQDNANNNFDDAITIDGKNKITNIISGDKTNNTINGDIATSNGATGYIITGDDTTNTFNSDSVSDGAIGIHISGNRADTTLNGKTTTTDGGWGVLIDGDDSRLDNHGTVEAIGTGSIGAIIEGDDSIFTNEGEISAEDGGAGVLISGNGNTTYSSGTIHADGKSSIGIAIAGNDANIIQNGDLIVTNGAYGILSYGEDNLIANAGKATVRDDGSIGFIVAGKNNTFSNKGDIDVSLNGIGTLVNGDESTVKLDGDILVTAAKGSDGLMHGATGVTVSGDANTTTISGDLNISTLFATDDQIDSSDSVNGVMVSGSGNTVTLDGELNMDVHDDTTSIDIINTTGLTVEGENNTVNITQGLNMDVSSRPQSEEALTTGIYINGANTVNLGGSSTLTINSLTGGPQMLANVQNGGHLILNKDSEIVLNKTMNSTDFFDYYSLLNASGEGSSIVNEGTIESNGITALMSAENEGTVINKGVLTTVVNVGDSTEVETFVSANGKNSTAHNGSGGIINLTSLETPVGSSDGGLPLTPITYTHQIFYAMSAYDYGEVSNDAGATISLHGAGVYGLSAVQGTALNAGDIYLDGFVPVLDDAGNIISSSYWQAPQSYLYDTSAAMIVGSDDPGRGDATAINTGTITIKNAGFGMTALNGGTAINQGTINLIADEGVTGEPNQLVAMAALKKGVVINDTTGVINIDADYGQAFLTDENSYVINNGTINLDGSPMADDDSHMGATPTDKAWIQTLPGSGESSTQTSDTGFFTSDAVANYGNATLNGDVDIRDWLYNETDASLTVNGELNINTGGLENKGTLNADTINTHSGIYNRADGSITTNLLTLNGNVTLFNEGDFTGSIAGTSYQQEIVNTGNMTVAADGKSLIEGSFVFYNQEGATLTNSGNAVEGGENTIINLTRTSDSLTQVNSGTITATNGYSAITTANASNNPVWIWNTATGVINGINPDAPLINLSRGFNFGNEGTINVQGDNAVAISGGTTSYNVNLVNSGTINVGTEQGQKDGTNGTGLIGIKGNGKATTINNTADGVINVYADNSYAFGGQTKAIINNGEINLLCDTGCDIYAPGTTGTLDDHNGTSDIAIPDANTAPAQGNVPDAPADPNAPQMLSNYIVGTNADGSSGSLKANNLVIGDNVEVNTGFTAGTSATTVVVDNAFTGNNIQGAEKITSTSVVWNAQGSTDGEGNVDVTMTKNAYADVATDGSVSGVAQALDSGYTNNELYTSLNVGTTAELNSALKQISGSQATTVFREARVLSNRFNMLANAAPQMGNGLSFNVVAKGDPRAELGNDARYDMLALRQTLDITESQSLTLEYGIARLDGSGAQAAGDNGVTGGYSQFFGLKHSMALNDDGLNWNNALRYDVHHLDSSRSVSYGDVSKAAESDARQQYLEFRSEGAKTFSMLGDALKVTPYAGVKLRHTMEDGYKERSAGDFNLSMNAGSETAVDSIVGMKLDYAGENGWGVSATLEGGPNLSYTKSQRTASLQGAAGQQFAVDDGQKGGGINSLASVGVKYSDKDKALSVDAYQWQEDNINDKGLMMTFKKTF